MRLALAPIILIVLAGCSGTLTYSAVLAYHGYYVLAAVILGLVILVAVLWTRAKSRADKNKNGDENSR